MLSENDIDWFAARLAIAVYDTNKETPEMAMWELKQAFPGLQTISTTPSGNQIFHFPDRDLEVGPMASNSEIAAALNNPWIRTENTKMSINPIDRLKDKLAKAAGAPARVAAKIEAKVDAMLAKEEQIDVKTDRTFLPHEAILDSADLQLDTLDVALNQLSNGGPSLS